MHGRALCHAVYVASTKKGVKRTLRSDRAAQLCVRLCHDWNLSCALRRFADQGAAMAVACGHEGRSHVAAEERDVRRMRAVADRQRAAGMVGVGRIAELEPTPKPMSVRSIE
jgi:hypothetical protein